MRRIFALLAFCLLQAAHAAPVVGVVSKVSDGDTLTLMTEAHERIRVRLTEIDAPESGQAFGQVSKRSLIDMCLHQVATVEARGVDRYGRTLGRVHCGPFDANAEQVKRGLAWAFVRYLTDPSVAAMEIDARKARVGLWQNAEPVAPWVYRKSKR